MRYILILLALVGCANQDLQKINYKVNSVPYVLSTDKRIKTPEEFYKLGGDCKDYVEAKYAALKEIGVYDDEMRFVVTSRQGVPHAVLEVRGVIMDNTTNRLIPAYQENGVRYTREQWVKIWKLMSNTHM